MSMYEKEWECCGDVTITKSWQPEKCPFCTALPSKPWVSLTDEEIATWRTVPIFEGVDPDQLRWIVRKTEAVLKERNT